jgi:hypothetical protein
MVQRTGASVRLFPRSRRGFLGARFSRPALIHPIYSTEAMVGPRFEQTAEAFQPRPLAAIELIAEEPIRLVKGRVAACDGGTPISPLVVKEDCLLIPVFPQAEERWATLASSSTSTSRDPGAASTGSSLSDSAFGWY